MSKALFGGGWSGSQRPEPYPAGLFVDSLSGYTSRSEVVGGLDPNSRRKAILHSTQIMQRALNLDYASRGNSDACYASGTRTATA
jgi:hypothetical protein